MVDIFAHRGAHYSERENTVASFAAAVALGVDGVELDVRETLDGELVIHHDPVAGGLMISQTRGIDLPTYVPGLDDAFTALAGVSVNVEIKNSQGPGEPHYDGTGDFARRVVTAIYEAGWSERVIITCFDLAEIRVGWLVWDVDIESALVQAHELGFNAVNPHFSLVTARAMREANELDLDVNVWTVNGSSEIALMAELDVASIITDDPRLARQVLANRV